MEAQQELLAVEARHLEELAAARSRLREATRGLSTISEMTERVRVAAWAYGLPKVHKADLAFAVCGNENHQWQLRKLLASPFRQCDRCGAEVLAGHKFESRPFHCEPCEGVIRANQAKHWNETERRSELKRMQRAERIETLKAEGPLTDAEANELAALLVACVDGPASQLAEYIRESLDGRNSNNPADSALCSRQD